MKTKGNDTAHPEIYTDLDRDNPMQPGDTYSTGGLTKRELFAAMAMQALLPTVNIHTDKAGCATDAVKCADALIAALNTQEPK